MKKEKALLLPLQPSLSLKIWGGTKLSGLKGISCEEVPLGETWEISTHQMGLSLYKDETLDQFLTGPLPYLVKLIDTDENLSIQAHPDDKYAREVENSQGKEECWVILDAKEGAGVYLGFKEKISRDQFEDLVEKSDDLSKYLNFFPVKKGDFFFVPAGTIHAIGGGVLLAEVQQSSGITYRVWDWNRLQKDGTKRELHVSRAIDIINFDNLDKRQFRIRGNIFSATEREALISHRDFNVEIITHGLVLLEQKKSQRPYSILCLEGELEIKSSCDSKIISKFEALCISNLSDENINICFLKKGSYLLIS